MKYYLLCLDKKYDVKLGQNGMIVRAILEGIIDNLVYLLQSYGIEDEEILEQFREQTDVYEKLESEV